MLVDMLITTITSAAICNCKSLQRKYTIALLTITVHQMLSDLILSKYLVADILYANTIYILKANIWA